MTVAEELATFVVRASYGDLSEAARRQLTMRVLDSLGCAIGALQAEPVTLVRAQLEDFGDQEHRTLISGGGLRPIGRPCTMARSSATRWELSLAPAAPAPPRSWRPVPT